MDNDDRPVGRVLSRREVLALFGTTGAAFLAACAGLPEGGEATQVPVTGGTVPPGDPTVGLTGQPTDPGALATPSPTYGPTNAPTQATAVPVTGNVPTCVVRPEMTEGPYFVDEMLNRSDIRVEPSDNSLVEGVPFELAINVSQIAGSTCTPLAGAQVDIWHCDALGVYSGVTDQMEGFDTQGSSFLRGYQITDESGAVRFSTIYPGWYRGRAVHIHFKIRTPAVAEAAEGQSYEFTSQFFFDDTLTDQVHSQGPYASKGQRDMRNNEDGIYQNGGDQLLLAAAPANGGYSAAFDIALDLSNTETGQSDAQGGPGGSPPRE